MRFFMTYIDWETDGEVVEDLPDKMVIELDDDIVVDNDDYVEIGQWVVDRASDETGWLIQDCGVHADKRSAPKGFDVEAFNEWARAQDE
jgi:hypothetical protein